MLKEKYKSEDLSIQERYNKWKIIYGESLSDEAIAELDKIIKKAF